jgi:hypothetical protein
MVKLPAEDPRLTRLTKIALALPGATRQIYGSHAQFLVWKKTFAYFLDNHHGDGIVAVTCKVLLGDNKALAESQPGSAGCSTRPMLPFVTAGAQGSQQRTRNERRF